MDRIKELNRFIIHKRIETEDYSPQSISKELDGLIKHNKTLVVWIESFYKQLAKRINWLINNSTSSAGASVYIGNSETDGSWRLYKSDGNLLVQKRISGTWTTQAKWTEP